MYHFFALFQAMTQEALSGEVSFSVLYTPFEKEDKTDKIKEANKTFAEKHPDYVQHIFTGNSRFQLPLSTVDCVCVAEFKRVGDSWRVWAAWAPDTSTPLWGIGQNVLYLRHQQNLSCWCKRLQSLKIQSPVRAGCVGFVICVLARFLETISLLLRLPSFFSKKVSSLTAEKKYDSGNYFPFPMQILMEFTCCQRRLNLILTSSTYWLWASETKRLGKLWKRL